MLQLLAVVVLQPPDTQDLFQLEGSGNCKPGRDVTGALPGKLSLEALRCTDSLANSNSDSLVNLMCDPKDPYLDVGIE